jgi:hypothetical protein
MFVAITNLSDAKGELIVPETSGLKPEQLGDKAVVERLLALGGIREMTAEEKAEAAKAAKEKPETVK